MKPSYEELQAERDALAAQVEGLQREFKDAQQTLQRIAGCTWDSGAEEIADVALDEAKRWVSRYDDSVLKSTPSACLAQVKADAADAVVSAIESGFSLPAMLNAGTQKAELYKAGWRSAYVYAKRHAERIRQGGE